MDDKYKSNVLWASTRYAALQRSNVYKKDAEDLDKKKFRYFLKDYLLKNIFKVYYAADISESQLYELINTLIVEAEMEHSAVLRNGKLFFGNAQKFVNTYLKSMWVVGWLVNPPPHFPVDSIIIKELKMKSKWTKMNEDGYTEVIKSAKNKLNDSAKSIAEWELHKYSALKE
ncbi:MAG: hypothetical protein HY842_15595 [Bacteroidetes bacterium]|nr:hypothetical protein [Bacteroidota bacterium]